MVGGQLGPALPAIPFYEHVQVPVEQLIWIAAPGGDEGRLMRIIVAELGQPPRPHIPDIDPPEEPNTGHHIAINRVSTPHGQSMAVK